MMGNTTLNSKETFMDVSRLPKWFKHLTDGLLKKGFVQSKTNSRLFPLQNAERPPSA